MSTTLKRYLRQRIPKRTKPPDKEQRTLTAKVEELLANWWRHNRKANKVEKHHKNV